MYFLPKDDIMHRGLKFQFSMHNATYHPFGILRHHWFSMFTFLFTFLFTWILNFGFFSKFQVMFGLPQLTDPLLYPGMNPSLPITLLLKELSIRVVLDPDKRCNGELMMQLMLPMMKLVTLHSVISRFMFSTGLFLHIISNNFEVDFSLTTSPWLTLLVLEKDCVNQKSC